MRARSATIAPASLLATLDPDGPRGERGPLRVLRWPRPFVAAVGATLLAAAIAMAGGDPASPPPADADGAGSAGGRSVRVLLLGDTGTGEAGQHRVAAGAAQVCALRGCDLALLLGDNFYESGVTSPYDPQFDTKFEQPYAAIDAPFWAVLGNHDNGGPGQAAQASAALGLDDAVGGLGHHSPGGDHQVAYHHRTDRASDKWRMPARYYSFGAGGGLVQFLGLDSNTLVWMGDPAFQLDPLGERQATWLRAALADSEAPWRVVFAHHPYVSNGQHGDAGSYEGEGVVPTTIGLRVKTLVEEDVCGRAQLYVAGHDHDLQWLKAPAACPGTEFLVSGAGAKTRPLADPARHAAWFQRGGALGFAWLEFRADDATGAFFDADGGLLYERAFPRAVAP